MRRSIWMVVTVLAGCRLGLEDPVSTSSTTDTCKVLDVATCNAAADRDPTTGALVNANFAYITQNILFKNCTGNACHQSDSTDTKAKLLVFDQGPAKAYASLVSDQGHPIYSNILDPMQVPLVAPSEPTKSYLLYITRAIDPATFDPPIDPPPTKIGFMPQANSTLCCQKLDLLEAWVTAGAQNN